MRENDLEAELLADARLGSADAFAELYRRHQPAAIRFATWLAGPDDAHDLASEAFAKTYAALERGRGPETAFKAYVLAAIRTINIDRLRLSGREVAVADYAALPDVPSTDDGSAERAEADAVLSAFRSLPQRWQEVLWQTAVSNEALGVVGARMGMSSNSVAALVHRARKGLRQAYLAQHHDRAAGAACAAQVEDLPKYVRGGLRGSQRARIAEHLDQCLGCATAAADLSAMSERLGAVLPPVLLAAGMTAPATGPVTGLVTGLGVQLKAWAATAVGHVAAVPGPVLAGAATVTAAAAVVGGIVVLGPSPDQHVRPAQTGTSLSVPQHAAPATPASAVERKPGVHAKAVAVVAGVAAVPTPVAVPSSRPTPAEDVASSTAPSMAPSPTPAAAPAASPSAPAQPAAVVDQPVAPAPSAAPTQPSDCTTTSSSSTTGTTSTYSITISCMTTYVYTSP